MSILNPQSSEPASMSVHNRWRTLILYIASLLVLILVYKLFVQPLQNDLETLQQNYADVSAQNKLLQQNLENTDATSLNNSNLAPATIKELSFPVILKTLLPIIQRQHLQLIKLNPLVAQENKDGLTNDNVQQNMALAMRGTYQQIISFFATLENAPTTMLPTTFKLQAPAINVAANGAAILNLDITLSIYAFKFNAHRAHIDFKSININKNPRDPFNHDHQFSERHSPDHAEYTDNDSSKITPFDNQNLRLLGTLQNRNKIWGIVSDANEKIYYMTVGMSCGAHHSKIKQITKEAIITENSADNIYRTSQ